MRVFNTTGPCAPDIHYAIPPLERSPEALAALRARGYLAISGPRQSGKTSLLKALVDAVNAEGWGRAALLSCEPADARYGIASMADAEAALIPNWLEALHDQHPDVAWPTASEILTTVPPGARLGITLTRLAKRSDRPLVLVLDEVDALARNPFGLLLRQVREGFGRRPTGFPHGLVFASMRPLRDHDLHLGGPGGGSPFNIVQFLHVGSFARDELTRLYAQHTAETGQPFTPAALDLVWEQTRGQPWLVNAIAQVCVLDLRPDRGEAVDAPDITEAIRRLEATEPTHLASLAARLAEPRVLRVVAPIVAGDAPDVEADDLRYAVELGILDVGPAGTGHGPANPIYARALLKALTARERTRLEGWAPTWLVEGRIDPDRLREGFLSFWAVNRNMMRDRIAYPEAVAHFGLMTWLDRVANGGGRVDREFAVGRGRLDLLLVHGDLRLPIEVKVHRDTGGDPVAAGLAQLDRYCAELRVDRGWLVVFDQRAAASGTRLEHEEVETPSGRKLLVIRA